MRRIFILGVVFLCAQLTVQAQGITFFKGTFAEAKAEAKKQNKYLFLDCYTTWCGPCNKMARDVFPQKRVGDMYNQNFVCYKLDMEKGEGAQVAKDFEVKAFPTYLYLNENGEVAHRTVGSREADVFLQDGHIANQPMRNLKGLTDRFNNGEKDPFLLEQLAKLSNDIDPVLCEKALTEFWKVMPGANITEKHNWELFQSCEKDINSDAYKFVMDNKNKLTDKLPLHEIDSTLYVIAANAMRTAADTKDEKLLNEAKGILAACNDKKVMTNAGLNELRFYRKTERWKEYVATSDDFLKKYGDNEGVYNSVAWEIFAHSDDQAALEKGLGYAEKSMELSKNYGNSDTYANLLWKLKKYKKAEKAAKESIELAKKEKLDYTSTQELLDKVQKSLAEKGK